MDVRKGRLRLVVQFLVAFTTWGSVASASAGDLVEQARARQRLYQGQLQDQLTLRLNQGLAGSRVGLSVSDRARLDRLALEQRLEQQQLHGEQMVESRRFSRHPERIPLHEPLYDQARELQLQHFYAEQQRLLGSMRSAPLQPVPVSGQLELR